MNGPTGYNIRFNRPGYDKSVLIQVSPSTIENVRYIRHALLAARATDIQVWRSGEHLVHEDPTEDQYQLVEVTNALFDATQGKTPPYDGRIR